MENFSVATLCPFMKTPNEPASTGWYAGSLSLAGLATAAESSRSQHIPTIRAVLTFTFTLLRNTGQKAGRTRSSKSQALDHFGRHPVHVLARGVDAQPGFQIAGPAGLIQAAEFVQIAAQGSIHLL